ncbi:AfsR/SARP family transcriptional regulator [Nocardiopsis metallicus]|uniref:AfsR/SARP family transcriptional regulator n=1 Tax=Nocardiopsis metallicus TaxID=179819 RepID=UPI0031E0EAA6
MRFGVLGPVAVWTTGGAEVAIPERKVRALLADLVLHRGHPVSADRLVEDVWGADAHPRSPERALQRKVWALRRALEEAEPGARDLVRFRAPGYLLDVPAEAVDAGRFHDLVASARTEERTRTRADLLAEALDLWRGPALADLADEGFSRPARTRLEEERLAAVEEHAFARLDLGEYRQVTDVLRELITAHPLRERLVAAHMRALYEDGRQADALAAYTALAERLRGELGIDPGPEAAGLHGRILRQEPLRERHSEPAKASPAARGPRSGASPGSGPLHRPDPGPSLGPRIPLPLTELLGREEDMRRVRSLLEAARLVTLTGFGGVGKTRLATALAHELDTVPADGARMVEFAAQRTQPGEPASSPVSDPAETLAHALGVRDRGGRAPLERLVDALEGQEVLLVLDNCEHVIDPVAELVGALLARLPGLRVLATSREPLGVPGETLHAVGPLPVPPADAAPELIRRSSAVRLFAARAAASAPGFALSDDNAADIALLTRRLDGIPLALELAATRVRTLGLSGVLCRLDDRFRLLATAQRHLPLRQRTLRAIIDWSWDLLDRDERILLRRLAVFSGGWTPEAAEEVCSGGTEEELAPEEVLDLLTRLVDRSLVVAADDPRGDRRLHLLESIAEYACQRLHEAGEAEDVEYRHALHYTGLAERARDTLFGVEQEQGLRRLDAEAANLRAALDTYVARGAAEPALRLAGAQGWYWYLRGRYREGNRFLARAREIDAPAEPSLLSVATEGAALAFAILTGSEDDHAARARAVLGNFDRVVGPAGEDVPLERARSALMLGIVLQSRGDQELSEDLVNQAQATFRTRADTWGLAASLVAQSSHTLGRGELRRSGQQAQEALDLFEELGDAWGRMFARITLAVLAEVRGDYPAATRLRESALAAAERLELWVEASGAVAGLGRIALLEGDFERADALHGRALEMLRGQGDIANTQYARMGLGLSARRQGRLHEAEAYIREMADWAVRVDWLPGAALALAELGLVDELRGDADLSFELHTQGLTAARGTGDARAVALGLEGIAGARSLSGQDEAAARLLGAAAAARESVGVPLPKAERGDVDRITERVRARLGEAGFGKQFTAGYTSGPEPLFAGGDPPPDLDRSSTG